MDLHTARVTPDWQLVDAKKRNAWQRLAAGTQGVVTPANGLSLLGFVLVCVGSWRLYRHVWAVGLGMIVIGRLADLADGYVANATGTKSPLGEFVDATCDKLAVAVVASLAIVTGVMPLWFVCVLLAVNAYLAGFGLLAGRKHGVHPNRPAKLATFAAWAAVVFLITDAAWPNRALHILGLLTMALFVAFSAGGLYVYHRDLRTVKLLKSLTH